MKTFIVMCTVFVFAISVILPVVGLHVNTGEGSQVGYVSAVEKSGLIFKTGRAYIKPTFDSTQEDIYCVVDDSVLNKLKDASVSKSRVEIKHISWLAPGIQSCGDEAAVIKSFNVIK